MKAQKTKYLALLGCLMNISQNQKSSMSRYFQLFDFIMISIMISLISHDIFKYLNSGGNKLQMSNLYSSCSLWFSAWDAFMNKLHENKSNLSTSLKQCLNKHDFTTSARHCQRKQKTRTLFNTRCEVVSPSVKSKYISGSALCQPAPQGLSL